MHHDALKAAWTVQVGLFPGELTTMKERHRSWYYTAADYEDDCEATKGETKEPHPEKPPTKFETCRKEAVAYWEECNDPAYQNWAKLTFTWM